jgi:small-conductance mechanosensitive channel
MAIDFSKLYTLSSGLGRAIIVISIILFTLIVASIVKRLLSRSFRKSSKILKVDPTQFVLLKHVISGGIYLIGFGIAIYMIPSLRNLSYSLLAGAGVLAVVIGFASQQAFSNIISGVFIAIFKPFRVDDRIKVGQMPVGIVEDITLRHTVIRNFMNKRIIIPNSVISDEVIENYNLVDERICEYVEFGISYDSDVDKAINIIQEESVKHKYFFDIRTPEEKKQGEEQVKVKVMSYGDFTVNLRTYVWTENPHNAFILRTDLNKSIKARFDREGIEIPFPYRTIVYKKDIEDKERKKKRKR